MFFQQWVAVLKRVSLGDMCQLIQETFHHETVLGMAHTTPECGVNPFRRLVAYVIGTDIGKCVRTGRVAYRISINAVLEGGRQPTRQDGAAGDFVDPCDGTALLVERGAQVVVMVRPQRTVPRIFLRE